MLLKTFVKVFTDNGYQSYITTKKSDLVDEIIFKKENILSILLVEFMNPSKNDIESFIMKGYIFLPTFNEPKYVFKINHSLETLQYYDESQLLNEEQTMLS